MVMVITLVFEWLALVYFYPRPSYPSLSDGEHYGGKWVYVCRTRSGKLRYQEE
jgi:hypothetical protein